MLRNGMGVEFKGKNFLKLLQENGMTVGCHCKNWT